MIAFEIFDELPKLTVRRLKKSMYDPALLALKNAGKGAIMLDRPYSGTVFHGIRSAARKHGIEIVVSKRNEVTWISLKGGPK